MKRITISLLEDEKEALHALAKRERRHPQAQAALLIRRELELAGLLTVETAEPGRTANFRPQTNI